MPSSVTMHHLSAVHEPEVTCIGNVGHSQGLSTRGRTSAVLRAGQRRRRIQEQQPGDEPHSQRRRPVHQQQRRVAPHVRERPPRQRPQLAAHPARGSGVRVRGLEWSGAQDDGEDQS